MTSWNTAYYSGGRINIYGAVTQTAGLIVREVSLPCPRTGSFLSETQILQFKEATSGKLMGASKMEFTNQIIFWNAFSIVV